jgi:nucleolar protein 4
VLKKLALHAIVAFEEEVAAGKQKALDADELAEQTEEDGVDLKKRSKKGKRGEKVIQSKIVRDTTKVDLLLSTTGSSAKGGKSKGYAFLELTTHANALRVLRYCNNNAECERLMRDWWLEDLKVILAALMKEKEKGKVETEERKERVKAIRAKIAELQVCLLSDCLSMSCLLNFFQESSNFKPSPRRLIMEFSIENIQVVKRREEKTVQARDAPKEPVKRKVRTFSPCELYHSKLSIAFSQSMLDGSFKDYKDRGRTKGLKGSRKLSIPNRRGGPRDAPPGANADAPPRSAQSKTLSAVKSQRKMSERVDDEKKKQGRSVGSLIGRKRKEKKEKRR